MNADDEAKFVAFAEPFVDSVDRESEIQWFLCVDGCRIQLLRSKFHDNVLICGRIALRTDSGDPDSKRAETLFNKFRRWIKKTYDNQLTVRNVNIPNSTGECRTHWIGPDLLAQVRNSDAPTLGQNRNAIVVFEMDAV